jgi:hypothetical protein
MDNLCPPRTMSLEGEAPSLGGVVVVTLAVAGSRQRRLLQQAKEELPTMLVMWPNKSSCVQVLQKI